MALPAAEVVADTNAGRCLTRGSATQSQQQLFENLPADVMGVRACCQQDAAFIYYYSDETCNEFGLPAESSAADPKRGLRFSLSNGKNARGHPQPYDYYALHAMNRLAGYSYPAV